MQFNHRNDIYATPPPCGIVWKCNLFITLWKFYLDDSVHTNVSITTVYNLSMIYINVQTDSLPLESLCCCRPFYPVPVCVGLMAASAWFCALCVCVHAVNARVCALHVCVGISSWLCSCGLVGLLPWGGPSVLRPPLWSHFPLTYKQKPQSQKAMQH